ncbi:MAG: hypothetical protein B6230_02640 [Desulfobacteraceae bacterium 4572_89]|nr:MAG: hypothetical protein B6230_02640 [Desulfobacteraceae bacterium 4572_89]
MGTNMAIQLKDIIDLDFLLDIDENNQSKNNREEIAARDRDIFNHLDLTGIDQTGINQIEMDDKSLIFSWLEYRKLVYFHGPGKEESGKKESNKKKSKRLPGTVFASLYRCMVYVMLAAGGLSGMSMAYSFLAYHGTRPINVGVFFMVFILLPVLLLALTLLVLLVRFIRKRTGMVNGHNSMVHILISFFFFRVLPSIIKKAGRFMEEKKIDNIEYASSLIQTKSREYKALFFFPFFIMSSLFSAAFSAGALASVLFRVAVSDMAFGWQSTLMTSSARLHGAISMISLPWSWFVPTSLAQPNLEQIEGSRILLKEGIASLATTDLVSWWPFLCMGILFYGVLPRVVLIMAFAMAQKKALDQFDFERPRFKRLVVRMRSPVMDVGFKEQPVSQARQGKNPLPDPLLQDEALAEKALEKAAQFPGTRALVLASGSVYGDEALGIVNQFINHQLFFDVGLTSFIFFDYTQDKETLVSLAAKDPADHIIVLQEVWQPPIRGLLHYFVQLKTKVFINKSLWIILTQTPGEESLAVDREDMNFKVWKKAVRQLGNPDIMLERLSK